MRVVIAAFLLAAGAAVDGSPYPQGVTSKIAPSSPAPKSCSLKHPQVFGLALVPLGSAQVKRDETEQGLKASNDHIKALKSLTTINGHIKASKSSKTSKGHIKTLTSSNTSKGQTKTLKSTNTSNRHINTLKPSTFTMGPMSSNGKIQTSASSSIPMVTQINDGQVQAPTSPTPTVISQISDGQIQAPKPSLVTMTVTSTITIHNGILTEIKDHQVEAPTTASLITSVMTFMRTVPASMTSSSERALVARKFSNYSSQFACRNGGSLELYLHNGVLTDGAGRTGYIASNFQFQFDNPPQSESIYTSGFSTCKNGSLALGGSTVFWRCLSGNFYNLYDRYWAPQCSPVELTMVKLMDC